MSIKSEETTLQERIALCHMHDLDTEVIKRAWIDNSGVRHHWLCSLKVKGPPGTRMMTLVEGLGMAEWWEGINRILRRSREL